MISALEIRDPSRSCVHHWDSVPWLKGRERIEFKPGLNILWGPNGSGKSTVLTVLARMLHCEQGGRTCITHDSVSEVFRIPDPKNSRTSKWVDTLADGVRPIHDGQCVLHFDPGHAVGLQGGGSAFDHDFIQVGVRNAMFHGSSGQTVMDRINDVLGAIVKPDTFPAITWRESKTGEHAKQVEAFLVGTIEKGQPTVLLDEPDRSLSLKVQAGLWHNLAWKYANHVQIIAASHSPFALNLPLTNYIETTPGYLEECLDVVDRFLPRRTKTGAQL